MSRVNRHKKVCSKILVLKTWVRSESAPQKQLERGPMIHLWKNYLMASLTSVVSPEIVVRFILMINMRHFIYLKMSWNSRA